MLQHDEAEAESYWQRALRYGLEANLASLLDEHTHVLNESLRAADKPAKESVAIIGAEIRTALSIHAASLRPDDIKVGSGGVSISSKPLSMRCRYAVRFGDQREKTRQFLERKRSVSHSIPRFGRLSSPQPPSDKKAWTSINGATRSCIGISPQTPVDLEQREGRVHRYKGYAVRKNVAKVWGDALMAQSPTAAEDAWNWMFDAAVQSRSPTSSDLVPYWVMDVEGGAKIERRFLITPFQYRSI